MPNLWIVRKTVKQPMCVCCISICTAFALTLLILGGVASGAFNFALDTSPASFSVKFDSIADRGAAFSTMRRHTTSISPFYNARNEEAGNPETAEDVNVDYYSTNGWYGMQLFFEAKGDTVFQEKGVPGANIFTPSNMRNVKRFEKLIRALPSYPKICQRKSNYINATGTPELTWCNDQTFAVSPLMLAYPANVSIPTRFYPNCCNCDGTSPLDTETCYAAPLCEKILDENKLIIKIPNGKGDEESVQDLDKTMSQLHSSMACGDKSELPNMEQIKYFVAADFASSDPPSTHTTRAVFSTGGVVDMTTFKYEKSLDTSPALQRWDHVTEGWNNKIWIDTQTFVLNEFIPMCEIFNSEIDNHVRVSGISSLHIQYEIVYNGLLSAAFWSIFSFGFVFAYMIFHTSSPFLTLMGLGHVLISFPVTWCIYYCVFQIQYMGFLNFIALFVIMGIGADDIFVFVDAWKQSKYEKDPKISGSIEGRLEWTYRRAGGAMLVTSITDACAFYANCINDITVVRIFGAFMGTMVIVNYLLVVTYFPAVVILWNKWGWEDGIKNQSATAKTADTETTSDTDITVQDEKKDSEELKEKKELKRQWLEIFCAETFAPIMFSTNKRASIVVVVFLIITGVFTGLASQLVSSDKDFRAEAFPLDENLMRASSSAARFDTGSNDVAYLAFVIGLGEDGTKGIDRSGVDPNNPQADGVPVFVKDVDFTSVKAQNYYINVCDEWKTNSLVEEKRYKPMPSENGVKCFAYHFRDWIKVAKSRNYPIEPVADFLPLLANFTSMPSNHTCNTNLLISSTMKKECQAFYSTMYAYPSLFEDFNQKSIDIWNRQIRWSTNSEISIVGKDSKTIEPLTSEAMNHKIRSLQLSTFIIEMNFTMRWDTSGLKARQIFNSLEKTQNAINANAPQGLNGFHVNWQGGDSGSKWMQMRTDEIMQTSAFYGCGISVLFALVVLSIATQNILVAFLAFISISCIVMCCIGFMVLAGWSFGLMEAICVTICVGFSIDFVAHLAVAYNESRDTEEGRYGKVKQALSELGISVTAAAVTTCGASLFMIPNYMTPFVKIGTFICFDIVISLLFAVFMFSATLVLCGPKDKNHCRIHCKICCRETKTEPKTESKKADVDKTEVEMTYTNPDKHVSMN